MRAKDMCNNCTHRDKFSASFKVVGSSLPSVSGNRVAVSTKYSWNQLTDSQALQQERSDWRAVLRQSLTVNSAGWSWISDIAQSLRYSWKPRHNAWFQPVYRRHIDNTFLINYWLLLPWQPLKLPKSHMNELPQFRGIIWCHIYHDLSPIWKKLIHYAIQQTKNCQNQPKMTIRRLKTNN